MDELQAQLQDELSRVVSTLEDITNHRSRWTGTLFLIEDTSARGRMNWSGDISLNRSLALTDLRWRTMIHETLHTLSQGLTASSYLNYRGWEEGVIEQLQRLLRLRVLHALGVTVSDTLFQEAEIGHRCNRYIDALEDLRNILDMEAERFYLELLNTPLSDRPAAVIQLAQSEPDTVYMSFRRRFAAASVILKGNFQP